MWEGFRLALQFLTRLQVHTEGATARDAAVSYYFYPAIGCAIGLAAVILRHAVMVAFPDSFSIVLILAFLVWVTGGLHEDGLADVADGMGGGWTREERLRIMKDARIGAFVTAQILGRWAFLPLGYFSVNAHEGLGSEFAKRIDANTVVVTTVFSGAVVILMSRIFGALAFCVAIIIVASAARYFRRRIGGVTGDCFGATFQFVEIATYAAFLT